MSFVAFDASGDLFVSYDYLGYDGVEEFPYNPATGTYASTGTAVASADQVGPNGWRSTPAATCSLVRRNRFRTPARRVERRLGVHLQRLGRDLLAARHHHEPVRAHEPGGQRGRR